MRNSYGLIALSSWMSFKFSNNSIKFWTKLVNFHILTKTQWSKFWLKSSFVVCPCVRPFQQVLICKFVIVCNFTGKYHESCFVTATLQNITFPTSSILFSATWASNCLIQLRKDCELSLRNFWILEIRGITNNKP